MAAVTVSTQYPIISWASGVSGVGTVWVSGTTFDDSLLSAVESAATAEGVGLNVGSVGTLPSSAALTKGEADGLYEPIGGGGGGFSGTVDGGSP